MNNYKQVTLKPRYISLQVPSDWQVKNLGDISDKIENGLTYDGKTRISGIPITRIETISNEEINVEKVGYLEKINSNIEKRYRLRYGDILFSHINSLEHIGKTAIYKDSPTFLIHGMNLIRIVVKTSEADPSYLLYLLKYQPSRNRFRAISNPAVNQVSINTTQLKQFQFVLPPLKEQREIASVLVNVDELIAKTDEVIQQIQILRKGLIQQLLIKGIGHDKFKTVFLGSKYTKLTVPQDWNIQSLSNVAKVIDVRHTTPKYTTSGYPLILPNNITAEGLNLKETKFTNKDDFLYMIGGNRKPEIGDIVYSRNATFGIACRVEDNTDFSLGQDLVLIKPHMINSYLLCLILNSNIVLRQLDRLSTGSTFQRINLGLIRNFLIPFPSTAAEQSAITGIIQNADHLILNRKQFGNELKNIKMSLMQKLVTGKIRVRI